MLRYTFFFVVYLWCSHLCAQSKLVLPENSKAKIKFESNSNLMIIPVFIQGVEMRFLVDTGVGHTLIFDNHKAQQLGFNQKYPFLLRGLGDQPALDAYQVKIDQLEIGSFHIENVKALVLPESEFILSNRLGTQIDGIIGCDLFESYPVLIDYNRKLLEINPVKKYKRWEKQKKIRLDLDFYNRKPYLNLEVPQVSNAFVSGFFLLDTGLSDALWLFSNDIRFKKSTPVFNDFLGTGINGDVYGERGKISSLDFGGFRLNEIKVAYPDTTTFTNLSLKKRRLGSVGAELLSRFKLIIDYPAKQLILKTNNKAKKPFYYNLSGMELAYEGFQIVRKRLPNIKRSDENNNNGIEILLQNRYKLTFHPALKVIYIRPNSPAHQSGIKVGDVLLQINGRKVHELSKEKVLSMLQKEPGEKIKVTIRRADQNRKFSFLLASFFSAKAPSP